jgi:hypothetical protein
MAPEIHKDDFLTEAIAGVPKIAGLVATLSPGEQARALAAAEQSYLVTARGLGYDEFEAQLWAATVMARLKIEIEEADLPTVELPSDAADLLQWPLLEEDEIERAGS